MTGYAQARLSTDGWLLRVSVRSVNHRFLDLRVRLPEGFESFEPQIRQWVRDRLRRGHVEVTLHLETVQGPAARVNREVAGAYLSAIKELRREFALAPEPDLVGLLRLPGVVTRRRAAHRRHAGRRPRAIGRARKDCVDRRSSGSRRCAEPKGARLAEEMHRLVASIDANGGRSRAAGRAQPPAVRAAA